MVDEMTPSVDEEVYCLVTTFYNVIAPNFHPIYDTIPSIDETYQKQLRNGDTKHAFLSAYYHGMCCLYTGAPLTPLTEGKFALIEEKCRDLNQPPSVYVFFSIYRQYSLNMRGKSTNIVLLNGKAMNEKKMMGDFDEGTGPYKQTLRDLSICKMIIACICRDLKTIDEMFNILNSWPMSDVTPPRLYLRLFWMTLGAFIIARANKNEEYLKLANEYMDFLHSSANKRNPNAKILFICLQAVKHQSCKNFQLAIDSCRSSNLVHFEALMNEYCGLYKLEKEKSGRSCCRWYSFRSNKQDTAETHLRAAMKLYYEYGAIVKVNQLKTIHPFLKNTS